ncbi:MAG: FAD-dependent oxidoreductase [Phycisphaerae bacterium]
MSQGDAEHFSIVGGGLGGALMACALGRAGHRVDLYEMRGDLRTVDIAGGRSINLALSTRGIYALGQVGLAEAVLEKSVPMRGRMLHAADGTLTFQRYGKDDTEAINSVSRGGLNRILLDAAERMDNVSLHFEHKCVGVDFNGRSLSFTDRNGDARPVVHGGAIVGADGAFSAVRRAMQRRDRFNYRQDYMPIGYKELTIPAGPGGSFLLEQNALHIWPRETFMMIALPNFDGSFTCTLFWPLDGPISFASVSTDADLTTFFQTHFKDALGLFPDLADEYRTHPTSSLMTVRCGPWHAGDRAVLIGDACHAVVPFFGQGMIAAFEDVVALTDAIRRHAGDRRRAFASYYEQRKEHCDALADLAIANFSVMAGKTRSKLFLLGKKCEKHLHAMFPKLYVPLYSMISFSRMGYADAVRRARLQKMVLASLVLLVVSLVFWWVGWRLS